MKKLIYIIDALQNLPESSINVVFECKTKVLPPFSFEPEAAYLTGKSPQQTDSGTHLFFDPHNSPFSNFRKILSILPDNPRLIKRILRRIFSDYVSKTHPESYFSIGFIPFKFLPYFSVSQNINLFERDSKFKYMTIFNVLKDYFYIGIPFENGLLKNIKKRFSFELLKRYDILFFYISDLDSIGHKYGASSIEYKNQTKEIFSFISNIDYYCDSRGIESQKIIFGDHGMVDINSVFDIQLILNKLPIIPGRDYMFFLDSILCRFWFYNKRAKNIILDTIPNCEYGSWITPREKKHYEIDYSHNKFGDAIWWASGGTLILPNFWQGNKKVCGMHGYRDSVCANNTMALGNFSCSKEEITMMELHEIIKSFLNITI